MVDHSSQVKSSVSSNTLNPLWGETFYFTYHEDTVVEATVYDQNFTSLERGEMVIQ